MDPNRPLYHDDSHFGRAPPDDAPATPPTSHYIPRWEQVGKHNCGNHHYSHGGPGEPGQLVLGLDQPAHFHVWSCRGCSETFNVVSLHFLPCHHALCRGCLNQAATKVNDFMDANKDDIGNMLANALLYKGMAEETDNVETEYEMNAEHAEIYDSVCEMAGFRCCGQVTRLGRFLYCIDAQVAMRLWCHLKYMYQAPEEQNHCGWPDCRAFVPRQCVFSDGAGFGPVLLHCPHCKGNSMLTDQTDTTLGQRHGIGNVWQPAGQPFTRHYYGRDGV